ncbi:MAG: glycosyltransferase [Rhodocyclaceae bacterium]
MNPPIHIVTHFSGIGGCETHAATLAGLLAARNQQVRIWADAPTAGAAKYGATVISPFGGRMPHGGTLILLGTHFTPGKWLDYAKPKRLIVICVLSFPAQVFAMLTLLERPTLPSAELAFVSSRLQKTLALPGILCPEPMDLQRFRPPDRSDHRNASFTLGRHSRDTLEKHHPDDPSLYRMLAWSGIHTHLLGGTCLNSWLGDIPEISTHPAGSIAPEIFLSGLDCFFYRTHPSWAEPSGRVVMEALACGLPIIAHESGGYTDWMEQGKNGYVFASQEEAYELVLRLEKSPQECAAMALAARSTAERESGGVRLESYLNWLTAS